MSEFRMLIAEKLLGAIISIAPNNGEGWVLANHIREYFEYKLKIKK